MDLERNDQMVNILLAIFQTKPHGLGTECIYRHCVTGLFMSMSSLSQWFLESNNNFKLF